MSIDPRVFGRVVGRALERGVEGGLKRAGLKVEKEARDRAPVDTGSLQSSITSQPRGHGMDMEVTVGPNVKSTEGAPYDVYQEFGTGIHRTNAQGKFIGGSVIRPRKSRVLAFKAKPGGWGRVGGVKTTKSHGGMVFTRSVKGVPPKRYMQKGFEATRIDKEFIRGFNATRK